MATYKLYWRPGSGSLVAEAALAMAGAPFDRIHIPRGSPPPAFFAVNPTGQVPAIVMPDGTVLTESAAMQIALDELFPDAGLLPPRGTAERVKALRWLMFLATSVYGAALRHYYPERFTTEAEPSATEAVTKAAVADLDRWFGLYADAVAGPLLLGDRLTIVDVYAAMLADWHSPAMESPLFKTTRTVILRHPAVSAAWDNHGYAR